jgi:hypothetical protein
LNAATASLNTYTSSNNTNISALNAQSASFLAYTASNNANITSLNTFSSSILSYTSSNDAKITSIYSTTSSLNSYTSSANTRFAGLDAASGSAITRLSALEVASGSAITRLGALETASGSAITRLGALETASGSAITRLNSIENKTGSYATTGSNIFIGTQTITGSIFGSGSLTINGCITSTGQIVAQTINVQTVTSSIVYSCGSNIFGTAISNSQQLTGSVSITGSLALAGNITSNGAAFFVGAVCTSNIISTGASGGRYGTFNAPTNGGYITFEAGGTPFGDLGSYCAQYGTGDATTLSLQSRTGYALALGTNSTEKVRIDTTGNLMVGSLSAGNAGTINVSVGCAGTTAGGLQLWATNAQTHYVQFGDGTAGAGPYAGYVGYNHSTDALLLGTGAATRAIITSAGVACFSGTVCAPSAIITNNLTVGGTSPIYLNFNAQASCRSRVAILYRGTQSGDACMIAEYGIPYLSIGGQENLVNSIQTIGFGFTNGTTYTQPAEIGFQTTSTSGYTCGDLVFATRGAITNTAPTERMRLNSSGNLGLGVTPSAWVDYKVLQFGGGSISSYTDNLFIEVNQNAFWNGSSYVYVNNGFASRYQQNVGRHEWYTAPSGTATNAISFTQAMTLDACGRLGIGITSPNAPLTLQANSGGVGIHIVGRSADGFGFLTFRNNANNTINGEIGISDVQNMLFYTGASVRLTIASTGIACFACQICAPNAVFNCLGVGAAWSTSGGTYQPIQIKSGLANSGLWVESCENDSGLYINHLSAGAAIGSSYRASAGYKDLLLQTAGSTRITIKCAGNVGINTTSPTGLLEVYRSTSGGLGGHIILSNNGAAVGNEMAVIFQDGGSGDVRAAISSTTEGAPYLGDIKFKTGLTSYGSLSTKMIITGAGNVGIGTTNPVYNLDVRQLTTGPVAFFGFSQTSSSSNGLIKLNSGRIPQGGSDFTGESGIIFGHSGGTGGVNFDGQGGYIKSIRLNTYAASGESDSALVFATALDNVDYERMRITSGGIMSQTQPLGKNFIVLKCITIDSSSTGFASINLADYMGATFHINMNITAGAYGNSADGAGIFKIAYGGYYGDVAGNFSAIIANCITNGVWGWCRSGTSYCVGLQNTGTQSKFVMVKFDVSYSS